MLARQDQAFLQDIEIATSILAGVQINRFPTGLTIRGSGPDGFDITVLIDDGCYSLYFDNWAEEFHSEDLARRTIEAALSGEARLKVETLSGRRWRWTLEMREHGAWVPQSTIGHVIWRFWGRTGVSYLRNAFGRRAGHLISVPLAHQAD